MAVLSTRDTVTLLHFTDSNESPWPDSVRTRILGMLRQSTIVGRHASRFDVPTPWRRLTFDRSSSTLDIVTVDAMTARPEDRHAEVPTSGSGVIVNHRINAAHDGHGDASGRYWIDVLTSKTWLDDHHRGTTPTCDHEGRDPSCRRHYPPPACLRGATGKTALRARGCVLSGYHRPIPTAPTDRRPYPECARHHARQLRRAGRHYRHSKRTTDVRLSDPTGAGRDLSQW